MELTNDATQVAVNKPLPPSFYTSLLRQTASAAGFNPSNGQVAVAFREQLPTIQTIKRSSSAEEISEILKKVSWSVFFKLYKGHIAEKALKTNFDNRMNSHGYQMLDLANKIKEKIDSRN